jgi:hypothetical protein
MITGSTPMPRPQMKPTLPNRQVARLRTGQANRQVVGADPARHRGGRLGISAKAATARHSELATSPRTKLICVYTRDWQDQDDVRRVLRQLRDLGVASRLSYKTDEATRLGAYGAGSAIYVSQPGSLGFDDRTHRPHPPGAPRRRTS